MSKAIDELKDKFYKRPLDYGAFWPLIFPAILDLAARLDEAEKRIEELELASPCPLLKSICEDWQYTVKPSPDKQEMVDDHALQIFQLFRRHGEVSGVDFDQVKDILISLIKEARHGQS